METPFLVLNPIKTQDEVFLLRNIRNECREFMTRDTTYITVEQQQKWYEKNKNNKSIKLYLLHLVELGVITSPIGYGLIREEDGYYLISGGLIKTCRGFGYGSILFDYLIKNTDTNFPIKLEVLKSNIKAFSIYNKLGFRVVNDDGKIITMEYYYDSVI